MAYKVMMPLGGTQAVDFVVDSFSSTLTTGPAYRLPVPLGTILPGVEDATLNESTANVLYPVGTGAEFILLAVPASTAIPLGTVVVWDGKFQVAVLPNTASTGKSVAVSVAKTFGSTTGISSVASTIQVAWFQIGGKVSVLKTATAFSPDVACFVSTTTGRIRSTSSTGRTVLNMRSANVASVTTTTSTVVCWINRPCVMGT